MHRKLTATTTLENLKKQSKRWLKALRENDAAARERLQRAHPNAPPNPCYATSNTPSRGSMDRTVGKS